jgi:hypothetical protein
MPSALVQIQAHAMLNKPQSEQTSPLSCVEPSRRKGDRCTGIDKVKGICEYQHPLNRDRTSRILSTNQKCIYPFLSWHVTFPSCLMILVIIFCLMGAGRFHLGLAVKDWFVFQLDMEKPFVDKHQDK